MNVEQAERMSLGARIGLAIAAAVAAAIVAGILLAWHHQRYEDCFWSQRYAGQTAVEAKILCS